MGIYVSSVDTEYELGESKSIYLPVNGAKIPIPNVFVDLERNIFITFMRISLSLVRISFWNYLVQGASYDSPYLDEESETSLQSRL